MSSLRQSPLPTLQALSSSFTELNTILQPLLSHNYGSLNSALQSNSSSTKENTEDELHGRLDAARMQVSVAYVLLDLVWILLKTKGVDTKDHPVMQELERVKSYFGKIKSVQDKEKEPAGEQSVKVDRSAAGRFIRAALAGEPGTTQGKHTKFEEETPVKVKQTEETPKKTEAKEVKAAGSTPTSNKKKRPAMDPFEGYDKPKTIKTASATTTAKSTDSAASTPSKKHKKSKKTSASK